MAGTRQSGILFQRICTVPLIELKPGSSSGLRLSVLNSFAAIGKASLPEILTIALRPLPAAVETAAIVSSLRSIHGILYESPGILQNLKIPGLFFFLFGVIIPNPCLLQVKITSKHVLRRCLKRICLSAAYLPLCTQFNSDYKDFLMGPKLEALYKLQKIEIDISQLRRRIELREGSVASQEGRISEYNESIEELNAARIDLRKKADMYEMEINAGEEKINKSRTELNKARTNKEYAAILTQINTQKADSAKLEQEGLEILSKLDAIGEDIAGVEENLEEERKRLEAGRKSIDEEIETIKSSIEQLMEKRREAAADIDPETLAIFEKLASKYEGEAMGEILEAGPNAYSCGGCFMSINSEHVNVLSSRDEIRQCDSCRRILYIRDESEDAD